MNKKIRKIPAMIDNIEPISKNKKITLVMPSFNGGGAQRVMINLSSGFIEKGFNVDFVVPKADGPYLKLVNENVRIIDLASRKVILTLFDLISYLKRENPDAILSTLDHMNLIIILAHILARQKGKLLIRVANNITSNHKSKKSIFAKVMILGMKFLYPFADKIVSVSSGVTEDLITSLNIPETKIKTIYNPAITSELIIKAKESLTHPWFVLKEKPIILGVGRLTQQKDFSTLIRAFSLVNQEYPARLIILGEGEEREKLQSLICMLNIENDVNLLGFVDNPFQYMKNASVFVLSSQWEGMPNVLLQAMACQIPVVSTNCPSGPDEILEDGKWGKLVPIGDVKQMAVAIIDSLKGKTLVPSEEILKMRFGIDSIVNQYLSIMLQ